MIEMIDFATLERSSPQNSYLVCPPGIGRAVPDRVAPVFEMSPARLRELWFRIVSREGRITMVAWIDDTLECEFIERSLVFKFPRRITVQFLPEGQGRATLAVYSRSIFGAMDLGVNRRRIERWLTQLGKEAAVAAPK